MHNLRVSSPLVSNATYYPFGPLNVLTWGNGRTLTKSYDQDYAIDQIVSSAATGLKLDLGVDVMGDITQASATIGANPPNRLYGYDPLYRLTTATTGATPPGPLEAYTYDKTGDRLSASLNGAAAQPYTYTPTTHQLHSVNGVTRGYDPNGNTQTGIGSAVLGYDSKNRLATATIGSITATYQTNGRGERVKKTTTGAGAATTEYVYDEAGTLIGEYGSTGAAQVEYIAMDGMPIAIVKGTSVAYVETDHLGTPRQVVNPSTNTALWTWDFLASTFGTAAPNQNPAGAGAYVLNARFPGQYYDAETGVHYNHRRDYDPNTGRYVESDPIGLNAGFSTYTYAQNDPILFSDPTGLYTTVRCGPVMSGGYHCEIVSRCQKTGETIAFGIGGGGDGTWQRLFGGKIPPKYQNTAPPDPGDGINEYYSDCGSRAGDDSCGCKQLECFKKMQASNSPPPYYALWQNSNSYARHLLSQCGCSLDFKPPGAVAW